MKKSALRNKDEATAESYFLSVNRFKYVFLFVVGTLLFGMAMQGAHAQHESDEPIRIPNGTESVPGLGFAKEPGTGLFHPAEDVLALTVGGQERMRFHPNGFVTIGDDEIHHSEQDAFEVEKNWNYRTYITATNLDTGELAQSGVRVRTDRGQVKLVMYPSTNPNEVMGLPKSSAAMLFTEKGADVKPGGPDGPNPAKLFVVGTRQEIPLYFASHGEPRVKIAPSGEVIAGSHEAVEGGVDPSGNVMNLAGDMSTVRLALTNTAGTGREWRLQSSNKNAKMGQERFSIRDQTAGVNRLVIDGSGNVGIGTENPETSASLDVRSTDEGNGFLPPRMTDAERDEISSPAEGLTIYSTDQKAIQFYNGTEWRQVESKPVPE